MFGGEVVSLDYLVQAPAFNHLVCDKVGALDELGRKVYPVFIGVWFLGVYRELLNIKGYLLHVHVS